MCIKLFCKENKEILGNVNNIIQWTILKKKREHFIIVKLQRLTYTEISRFISYTPYVLPLSCYKTAVFVLL